LGNGLERLAVADDVVMGENVLQDLLGDENRLAELIHLQIEDLIVQQVQPLLDLHELGNVFQCTELLGIERQRHLCAIEQLPTAILRAR
jgi:hypothetical protein